MVQKAPYVYVQMSGYICVVMYMYMYAARMYVQFVHVGAYMNILYFLLGVVFFSHPKLNGAVQVISNN